MTLTRLRAKGPAGQGLQPQTPGANSFVTFCKFYLYFWRIYLFTYFAFTRTLCPSRSGARIQIHLNTT